MKVCSGSDGSGRLRAGFALGRGGVARKWACAPKSAAHQELQLHLTNIMLWGLPTSCCGFWLRGLTLFYFSRSLGLKHKLSIVQTI